MESQPASASWARPAPRTKQGLEDKKLLSCEQPVPKPGKQAAHGVAGGGDSQSGPVLCGWPTGLLPGPEVAVLSSFSSASAFLYFS